KIKPKIQTKFADLKKELGKISMEEWKKLEEIPDYTIKRRKFDIYTPLPDTLLERAKLENERVTSIDVKKMMNTSGMSTSVDLRALGEARESILKNQLTKFEKNVSGTTTVDPKGYITS